MSIRRRELILPPTLHFLDFVPHIPILTPQEQKLTLATIGLRILCNTRVAVSLTLTDAAMHGGYPRCSDIHSY